MGRTLIEIVTGGTLIFPIVGIILGIILLVNGGQDKAKKVLASYFFLYAISVIIANIYYYIEVGSATQILDPITILCQSLVLPILMLYALELFSKGWATVTNGVMVYMPVILFVVIYTIVWVVVGENPVINDWQDFGRNVSNPLVWMRFISIGIALFYSSALITLINFKLQGYTHNVEKNYSYVDGFEVDWLKWVSYLFMALCILFILLLLIPGRGITYIYAFCTWVIWIILFVKGVKQSNVELVDDIAEEEEVLHNSKVFEDQQPIDNEHHESQDSIRKTELKAKILELLNDKNVYLNPELSLQHLALIAGSNRSYVSKVINEEFGVNFFDLINEKRVEYAKLQLSDSKNNNYSLNFIGQLCGFKCDRTMYRAFIKFTGESPSKYRMRN